MSAVHYVRGKGIRGGGGGGGGVRGDCEAAAANVVEGEDAIHMNRTGSVWSG